MCRAPGVAVYMQVRESAEGVEHEGRAGDGQRDYMKSYDTESEQITCPYKSKDICNVYSGRHLWSECATNQPTFLQALLP